MTKSKDGAAEVEEAELLAALEAGIGWGRSGAVSAFDEEPVTE